MLPIPTGATESIVGSVGGTAQKVGVPSVTIVTAAGSSGLELCMLPMSLWAKVSSCSPEVDVEGVIAMLPIPTGAGSLDGVSEALWLALLA